MTTDQLKDLQERLEHIFKYLEIEDKRAKAEELKQLTISDGFWDDQERATAIIKELNSNKYWIELYASLKQEIEDIEVLYEFLEKIPNALAEGGRVAILSFHSGEDRLVKKSFQRFFREGVYSEIAPNVIRPSLEECNTNSRARSAKLRWAIKA